jgi:hypothetical protein
MSELELELELGGRCGGKAALMRFDVLRLTRDAGGRGLERRRSKLLQLDSLKESVFRKC